MLLLAGSRQTRPSRSYKLLVRQTADRGRQYCPAHISDLPHSGPKIFGVSSKYLLGDTLLADCMLPQSHPPAILTWYINSDTADPSHTSSQHSLTRNIDPHIAGNESAAHHTLGQFVAVSLNFTIKEKHVRQVEGVEGGLSLKCTAEVLELYWRTSEVSVSVARSPRVWFSPALSSSSSSSQLPLQPWLTVLALRVTTK